jgi:hypothetical protein
MKSVLGWVFWVVLIAGLIAFQAALFGMVRKDPSTPKSEDQIAEKRVMVTRQEAQGVTEADIDAAGAQRFADYAASRSNKHAEKYAKDRGWLSPTEAVIGEGTVIEVDGRRLVIVRLKADGAVIAVEVIGIDDDELVRVLCTGDLDSEATLTDPACMNHIEATFGVRIAP